MLTNSTEIKPRRYKFLAEHVLRNWITIPSVVHRLFFQECHQDASRKVLSRMVHRRLLVQFPLFGRQSYYRLGKAAIAAWQCPVGRSQPLGAQRLPYELGTLAYMCLDEIPRKRLLRNELLGVFPQFPLGLMTWAYFFQQTDSAQRLMTLRIETRTRADRAVQKLGEQIHSYRQTPFISRLVDNGELGMVVVTATPEQEAAVREEADRSRFPIEIVTAHYPPLYHFV